MRFEHRASPQRRRLVRARRVPLDRPPPLNLDPATTYEVLTRQMVDDLTRDVAATRQRVDTMFYLVIGSIVLDVLLRLGG
jgi:hypothetical protein